MGNIKILRKLKQNVHYGHLIKVLIQSLILKWFSNWAWLLFLFSLDSKGQLKQFWNLAHLNFLHCNLFETLLNIRRDRSRHCLYGGMPFLQRDHCAQNSPRRTKIFDFFFKGCGWGRNSSSPSVHKETVQRLQQDWRILCQTRSPGRLFRHSPILF